VVEAAAPRARLELVTYLALTFGLSAIWYVVILTGGGLAKAGGDVVALTWSPALAAIATQLAFRRTLAGLGWRWPGLRWVVLGYLIPLGSAIVAYGVVWLTRLGGVDLARRPDWRTVVLGSLLTLALATGEEIGWRGFLVPALARSRSLIGVAVASGLVWGAWHLPFIVFADHDVVSTPKWYAAICFTTTIVAISLPMAWLRLRSGSFWPAAFLHASHNFWIQSFFERVTVPAGITRWLTGAFGAAPAIALCVTAALILQVERRQRAASGTQALIAWNNGEDVAR